MGAGANPPPSSSSVVRGSGVNRKDVAEEVNPGIELVWVSPCGIDRQEHTALLAQVEIGSALHRSELLADENAWVVHDYEHVPERVEGLRRPIDAKAWGTAYDVIVVGEWKRYTGVEARRSQVEIGGA